MKNLLRLAMILCAAVLVLQPVFLQHAQAAGNQCEQPEEPEPPSYKPVPDPAPDPAPIPAPEPGPNEPNEIVPLFKLREDNPEHINPGDSVSLNVEGGTAPYNWSVGGAGYSLGSSATSITTNTFTAEVCAKDPAIVTVTDANGQTDTMVIESTYMPLAFVTGSPPDGNLTPGIYPVGIFGGAGTYIWTISGDGFSFEGGTYVLNTTATSVNVVVDSSACGTATITVSDDCGETINGSTLSENGQWGEPVISYNPAGNTSGCKDYGYWNCYPISYEENGVRITLGDCNMWDCCGTQEATGGFYRECSLGHSSGWCFYPNRDHTSCHIWKQKTEEQWECVLPRQ